MSLPTNLNTLDYAFLGGPFIRQGAGAAVNTQTMDFAYLGAPFVGNQQTGGGGGGGGVLRMRKTLTLHGARITTRQVMGV